MLSMLSVMCGAAGYLPAEAVAAVREIEEALDQLTVANTLAGAARLHIKLSALQPSKCATQHLLHTRVARMALGLKIFLSTAGAVKHYTYRKHEEAHELLRAMHLHVDKCAVHRQCPAICAEPAHSEIAKHHNLTKC